MNVPFDTVPNRYSANWFAAFLEPMPPDLTAHDVEAITKRLPRPAYHRVLDAGCGYGRIALPLLDFDYAVTGVDQDRRQLDIAREQLGDRAGRFIAVDLRDVSMLQGPFDAILSLWQSFGYFASSINDAILGDYADLLRPQGRLLLDLFHPGFFDGHQGTKDHPRPGVKRIVDVVDKGRLHSEISYDDGTQDIMDFELFEPDDLVARAAHADLELVELCTWWDPSVPPSSDVARYQAVFQRS